MSNIVFILGAGASKAAGAPLMSDFLDVASDLHWRDQTDGAGPEFEAVFKGISALQEVHSKARLDIQNLEAVFAAFEMARTLGGFADYQADDVQRLLSAMRTVIVKTLEKTIALPFKQNQITPPQPYLSFGSLVKRSIEEVRPSHSVSIITFNYDILTDLALHWHQVPIDYGLEEPIGNAVPLLKFHGSLNWGHCNGCDATIPWRLDEYFKTHTIQPGPKVQSVTLPIGSQLTDHSHCDQPLVEPVIVPPTWNKTEYHRGLGAVWRRSARQLAEADSIFVIGFSLPPSDAFFPYLYALGTAGGVPLRRLWVFNPDSTGEVEPRFRALLGPGAEQRFEFYRETFQDAVPRIAGSLGVDITRS